MEAQDMAGDPESRRDEGQTEKEFIKDSSIEDSSSDTSSLSSSSESDASDAENSPAEHQDHAAEAPSSLRDRLHAFLPQLHQANANLNQSEQSARSAFEIRMENSDEEDEGYSSEAEESPYIEMNLGLGVLEQEPNASRGDIELPQPPYHDHNQPKKRKTLAGEDEFERDGMMSQLSNIRGEPNEHEEHRKKSKRSKVEVVGEKD
ncbi:MAG: hypothetical protein Q9162_000426 [Coniocarpon cinnabarinum]